MADITDLLNNKETADSLLARLSTMPLDSTHPGDVAFATFFAHLSKGNFRQAHLTFTVFKPIDLLSRPQLAVAGILLLVFLTESAPSTWESSKLLCEATVYATELHMRAQDCKAFEDLHDAVISFSSGAVSSFLLRLDKLARVYEKELAPLLPSLYAYVNDREKKGIGFLHTAQVQIEEPFTRSLIELATLDAAHGKLV